MGWELGHSSRQSSADSWAGSQESSDSGTYSRTSASSRKRTPPRRADEEPFAPALAGGDGLLECAGDGLLLRATLAAGVRTGFVRRRGGGSSESLASATAPARASGSSASGDTPALAGGSSSDVLRVALGLVQSANPLSSDESNAASAQRVRRGIARRTQGAMLFAQGGTSSWLKQLSTVPAT